MKEVACDIVEPEALPQVVKYACRIHIVIACFSCPQSKIGVEWMSKGGLSALGRASVPASPNSLEEDHRNHQGSRGRSPSRRLRALQRMTHNALRLRHDSFEVRLSRKLSAYTL